MNHTSRRTACFLLLEGILYAVFLMLDGAGASHLTVWPKFTGILLCLLFSLFSAFLGGDRLVPAALAFTLGADSLLLVANAHYELGVLLFLCAQCIYLIRLRTAGASALLPLRAGLPLLAFAALWRLGLATPLNLLAGLYFSQLLINLILAWTLSGRRFRLFAAGLTLFACCDICVGLFNSPQLIPAGLHGLAAYGMWLFYLPSQVLIALSALPQKEVSP